jgi:16S rRNA (adenine1518-N6/adenine1519-N6)-dimethyltransferase
LNRVFGDGSGKLAIIEGDALKIKWPEKASHLIANLPYQISSPILEKIQQHHAKNPFDVVVLLVQDEFAERMSMDHFGSLSTLGLSLWLDFDVKLDRKVPGGAFSPAPRVNSRLVVLNPVNRLEEVGTIDRKMFKIITKHCFASRRKKLRSLLAKPPRRLSRVKGWHKARWNAAMNHIYENTPEGLDSEWFEERPDVMEPEEWVMIANAISSFEGDF